jgi:hypothetical protein
VNLSIVLAMTLTDLPNERPNEHPKTPQNDIFKPRIKSGLKAVDPNQLLYAEDLLCYYKFALEGRTASQVLRQWAQDYPVEWIRLAIIEALYQGRYKAVSVEQILQNWQRRSQAQPRFDDEFAQLIRQRLPDNLAAISTETTSAVAALAADIHSSAHIKHDDLRSVGDHRRLPATTHHLDDLTQFVQTRRSRRSAVDAVINHAEANIDRAADQAKQQLTQSTTPEEAAGNETTAPSTTAIHQFTPTPQNAELIARLKSVSTPPDSPDA